MFFRFLFLSYFSLLVLSATFGCVNTKTTTRNISRLRPIEKTIVKAQEVSAQPISLRANSDLLTEEEFARVKRSIREALQKHLKYEKGETKSPVNANVKLEIQRATLDAYASAKETAFRATCRVSLVSHGLILAEASAETQRIGGPKMISEVRAAKIAKLERNPLLKYKESEKVLVQACLSAAVELEDVSLESSEKNIVRDQLRQSALSRLQKSASDESIAAAMIELGDFGVSEDGQLLLEGLKVDFKQGDLKARAAANALARLCPPKGERLLKGILEDGVHNSVERDLKRALQCVKAMRTLNNP